MGVTVAWCCLRFLFSISKYRIHMDSCVSDGLKQFPTNVVFCPECDIGDLPMASRAILPRSAIDGRPMFSV